MTLEEGWPDEIDAIYAAVGDERRFCDALAALRPRVGAATVLMTTMSMTPGGPCRHIAAAGVPAEAVLEYESHFREHDVWLRAMQARGLLVAGALIRTDDLVDVRSLRRSYFWRAFLSRHDTVHGLAVVLETADESGAFTFLRFHRGERQPVFGEPEMRQVRQWLPHLRNATRLHRRLSQQIAIGKTFEQLFGEARSPMIVLDGLGSLTRRNAAWEAWSALHADHVRVDGRGQLALRDRASWHSLSRTLRALLHDRSTPGVARMHVGGGYELLLRRIERGPGTDAGLSEDQVIGIVEFADERRPEDLRQRFDLTPAQARVAAALAAGRSAAQAAAALGISLATVRTHITVLYRKTGTSRQPALVARLLGRDA